MKKKELKQQLKWTRDANARAMTVIRAHYQEKDILLEDMHKLENKVVDLEATIETLNKSLDAWRRDGYAQSQRKIHPLAFWKRDIWK